MLEDGLFGQTHHDPQRYMTVSWSLEKSAAAALQKRDIQEAAGAAYTFNMIRPSGKQAISSRYTIEGINQCLQGTKRCMVKRPDSNARKQIAE